MPPLKEKKKHLKYLMKTRFVLKMVTKYQMNANYGYDLSTQYSVLSIEQD